ncbi:MAG: ABC transporter permease subunit [Anaerolineae bacterium]|nr:ABC transporter permease subunit [Anaerolineae bacterium]
MTQGHRPDKKTRVRWRTLRTLALRDLRVVTRSKAVMLPMLIVPLIFIVALPAGIGLFAPQMAAADEADDLTPFLEMMPPAMAERFAGYNDAQILVVAILEYLFAPMFLIVPLMVASTIAADSFAGEKERKTLEGLLHTPTTDAELFLGKLLAAWIPAVLVTLGAFVLYAVVANLSAWRVMGGVFFPSAMWVVLVLWLAPAAAGVGLGTMILVSSKVSTFQDAYQLSGLLVLPVLLLVFGQLAGVLYLSVLAVLVTGLLLWVIDAAILWLSIRTFKRTEIIARL